MKLKATKRYVDKYTKKIIEKGDIMDVDKKRAEELMKQKVAEPEKESKLASGKEEQKE